MGIKEEKDVATMEIVVGTYEELILGYKIKTTSEKKLKLEQSFTDHSHVGCIKTVAVSPKGVLASGSSDEMIRIYNLKTRQEMGTLAHHNGTITKVDFHGRHHMLTSSEDGTLGVWKTGRWECLRTLRGHKSHVLHFAVHPSGKLALSVSKDRMLKTWNLMTGKCAYTTHIKTAGELILWSPQGDEYVIIAGQDISVYKVETGTVHQTIQCSTRISCAVYLRDHVLAVGCEGGEVHLFNIEENSHITQIDTETNRVKSMCHCRDTDDEEWLVTASSDGQVQMWTLTESETGWEAERQVSHNTNFRPTCVTVYVKPKDGVKGHQEEEVQEEVEETEDVEEEDAGKKDGLKKKKKAGKKRKVVVETETYKERKMRKQEEHLAAKNAKSKKKKMQLF